MGVFEGLTMDERDFAENILEYVISQCQDKEAEEMMDVMTGVLGQLKEHKFEKLERELGIFMIPPKKGRSKKKDKEPSKEKAAKNKGKKLKKLKKKNDSA